MGRKRSQRAPKSKEFVSSSSDTDLDEIVNYIEGNLSPTQSHMDKKKTPKKRGNAKARQTKRVKEDTEPSKDVEPAPVSTNGQTEASSTESAGPQQANLDQILDIVVPDNDNSQSNMENTQSPPDTGTKANEVSETSRQCPSTDPNPTPKTLRQT